MDLAFIMHPKLTDKELALEEIKALRPQYIELKTQIEEREKIKNSISQENLEDFNNQTKKISDKFLSAKLGLMLHAVNSWHTDIQELYEKYLSIDNPYKDDDGRCVSTWNLIDIFGDAVLQAALTMNLDSKPQQKS